MFVCPVQYCFSHIALLCDSMFVLSHYLQQVASFDGHMHATFSYIYLEIMFCSVVP